MAEEKKVPATGAKPNFLTRFGNWWVRLFKRIVNAFKNMWTELKRVSWPTKKKWTAYSIIVLVFILVMSIVVGLLDTGASTLIRLLVG